MILLDLDYFLCLCDILGNDLPADIVSAMVQTYPWPAATIELFPTALKNAYRDDGRTAARQTLSDKPDQASPADLTELVQQVDADYNKLRSWLLCIAILMFFNMQSVRN